MKLFIYSLLVLLFSFPSTFAQFQLHQSITPLAHGIKDIQTADIDGDGFLDVVSISATDNKTAWYRNLGNKTFGHQRVISLKTIEPESMKITDVNKDGFPDLFVASSGDERIRLFMNDGTGRLTLSQIVLEGYKNIYNLVCADMDNDEDIDLVAGALRGKEIAWFANDGQGNFGEKQVITDQSNWWTEIDAGDLDNDGDLDIVAGSEDDDEIVWFPNLGVDGFGEKRSIPLDITFLNRVKVWDVNQDGYMDIVVQYYRQNLRKIIWLENDGEGVFQSEKVITNEAGQTRFVDFDLDGSMDIVTLLNAQKPRLFTNLGNGEFSPFEYLYIDNDFFASILITDLDNDLQQDFLVVSRFLYENEIRWFKNVTSNHFVEQLKITSTISRPCMTYAIDLDQDNDMDILVGSVWENTLYWYENDGEEHFHRRHLLSSNFPYTTDMTSDDLDEDGDVDILVGVRAYEDSKLFWFENNGDNMNWERKPLDFIDSYVSTIEVSDVDIDGDLDIVVGAFGKGEGIGWIENMGGGKFEEFHVIDNNVNYVESVFIADMDADGMEDILMGTDMHGMNICWYRNEGNGLFGEERYIGKLGTPQVSAADLNGDGNLEIIASEVGGGKLIWFENNGGGNFGEEQIISDDLLFGGASLHLNDLDNDGNMDIVAASERGNYINWFLGQGDGKFDEGQLIQTPYEYEGTEYNASFFQVADINGNGKQDFLITASEADAVIWYENIFFSTNIVAIENSYSIHIRPNPFSDFTTIEVEGLSQNGNYRLEVMDILGRKVRQLTMDNEPFILNRGELESGLYLIQVLENNGRILGSEKILVE